MKDILKRFKKIYILLGLCLIIGFVNLWHSSNWGALAMLFVCGALVIQIKNNKN